MSLKYVALALGIFLLAFSASLNAAEQGFLEGHLKIIFGMATQPSDDMPRPEIAPESYAEYPLVVLSQENNKEIARVTADRQGNYRVPLPPGNYVLDVQDRVRKRVRTRPQPFTVVSNQIARVDMNVVISIARAPSQNTTPVNDRNIDTGIRWFFPQFPYSPATLSWRHRAYIPPRD